jgi:hypothetical protein
MATHTSATTRVQAPDLTSHANQTSRTATIVNALKRRAQAVLNDESLDAQTRAIIRYGLETNDPWLAEIVRRADAGEKLADSFDFSQTTQAHDGGPTERRNDALEQRSDAPGQGIGALEPTVSGLGPTHARESKIEALAEIICGAGDEAAGALFVLMGMLQHSTHSEVLANMAKHLAFTRCGELNLFGMVDAQIAVVEGELLAHGTPVF